MEYKLLKNIDTYYELTFKLVGFSYYVSKLDFENYDESTVFCLKHDYLNAYNQNAIAAYYNDKLVAYISEKDLDRVGKVLNTFTGDVFCKCQQKTKRHMNVILCTSYGHPKKFLLKQERDSIESDLIYEKRESIYEYTVFPWENGVSDYDSVIRTVFDVDIKAWVSKDRDINYRQILGSIDSGTVFSLRFYNSCPIVYKEYDKENCKYYFVLDNEERTLIRFEEFKSHILYGAWKDHTRLEKVIVTSVIPRCDVSNLEIYRFIKRLGEDQKYITRTGPYYSEYYVDHGEHGPERNVYRNYPYIEKY